MNFSELVAVNVLKYIDGISGQITSPDYPGNYPNNANYTWIIRTGSRSAKVTFRIIEMNIEKWECDDYLEVNLKMKNSKKKRILQKFVKISMHDILMLLLHYKWSLASRQQIIIHWYNEVQGILGSIWSTSICFIFSRKKTTTVSWSCYKLWYLH